METVNLEELVYRTGLYLPIEVDRYVGLPENTTARWGSPLDQTQPIVTRLNRPRRSPSIPFVGIAEATMLKAFRKTGLSMQRIRPAVQALRQKLNDDHALLSERLYTDGAEILYEYAEHADGEAMKLVVARNGQTVMTEVIESYLQRISFFDECRTPKEIDLTLRYGGVHVSVNPQVNGGVPTLKNSGLAVGTLMGFLEAGETYASVAAEYDLDPGLVEQLAMCA